MLPPLSDFPLTFTMRVGWTSQRPVVPDQHVSHVVVMADTANDAHLLAAYMLLGRRHPITGAPCVMVTSTHVLDVIA